MSVNHRKVTKPAPLPPVLVRDSDDLDQRVKDNAKYFTVIQCISTPESRYTRFEVKTFDEAMDLAKKRYEETKIGALIYAVADIPGASNIGRNIASYPDTSYKSAKERKLLLKKK